MDPAFPLYRRELATLQLAQGHSDEAVESLTAAVRLNPNDDSFYRALALASLAAGQSDPAMAAAHAAVRLKRTEPLNLATLAYVAEATGERTTRDGALRLLVALSPWSAADPAWSDAFPGMDPLAVVADANRNVSRLALPRGADARWLAVFGDGIAGQPETYTVAQLAFDDLLACRVNSASADLTEAQRTNAADREYWLARWVTAQMAGMRDDASLAALVLLSAPVRQEGSPLAAPLLDETGYSRLPIALEKGLDLPSVDDGIRAWIRSPESTLRLMRGGRDCG
jgi:tetratricopeptide (TPR) repeat protein